MQTEPVSVEPVTIYAARGSAPCRAVILLARYLSIPHEVVEVDLPNGEHKSDWFIRLNPEHCVPTITDRHGPLWESRAILLHLMASAGQHTAAQRTQQLMGSLEPLGNVAAHVLRALFWDAQTLYPAIAKFLYPQLFGDVDAADLSAERATLDEALATLQQQIDTSRQRTGRRHSMWVCGSEEPTVADLAIAMSLTMLRFVPDVLDAHAGIKTYVDRVAWRFEPHWSSVNEGLDEWLASTELRSKH